MGGRLLEKEKLIRKQENMLSGPGIRVHSLSDEPEEDSFLLFSFLFIRVWVVNETALIPKLEFPILGTALWDLELGLSIISLYFHYHLT